MFGVCGVRLTLFPASERTVTVRSPPKCVEFGPSARSAPVPFSRVHEVGSAGFRN